MRGISLNRVALYVGLFFVVVYATLAFMTWKSSLPAYSSFLTWSTWCPVIFSTLIFAGLFWRARSSSPVLLFKTALQYAFLAYVIYEIGCAIINVVLYDILDKTLYTRVLEYNLDKAQAFLNRLGSPASSYGDTMEKARQDAQKGMSAMQVLIGVGQSLLFDFVKALLIALALQRKAPVGTDIPGDFGSSAAH